MLDNGKYVTYYQNPFYDEVFGFLLEKPVPPKQRKGKSQNREFENLLREDLKDKPNPLWPYKERLLVVLSITGPMNYLNNIDIDNVTKAILDVCKGIVFVDDNQVFSLIAEKHVKPITPGFSLAIKKMQDGEVAEFVPAFFTSDPLLWKEERLAKYGPQQ